MKKWTFRGRPCFAAILCFAAALICVPFLACAGGSGDNWSFGIPIRGNGKLITSEIPLSAFKTIGISGMAAVTFHESREYRAVATFDSNLEEYVRIYTRGDTLVIGKKGGRPCFFTQYTVDVYCPGPGGAAISGSGSFEGGDKISVPAFTAAVSGSGKINANIACDKFSANISGSGDINAHVECTTAGANISGAGSITLTGNARETKLSISGSGDFIAGDFKTNKLAVRISGSGRAYVWALDTLEANISGSGTVKYRGTPIIDFRGSGSGRLVSE